MNSRASGLAIPDITPECRVNTPVGIDTGYQGSIQTDRFLELLGLEHIWTVPYSRTLGQTDRRCTTVDRNSDVNAIDLDDEEGPLSDKLGFHNPTDCGGEEQPPNKRRPDNEMKCVSDSNQVDIDFDS
jgi:hypothetical protein